jgi:hypothetical protein
MTFVKVAKHPAIGFPNFFPTSGGPDDFRRNSILHACLIGSTSDFAIRGVLRGATTGACCWDVRRVDRALAVPYTQEKSFLRSAPGSKKRFPNFFPTWYKFHPAIGNAALGGFRAIAGRHSRRPGRARIGEDSDGGIDCATARTEGN